MTTINTLTLSGTTYSFIINGTDYTVRVETKNVIEEHVRSCICSAMGLYKRLTQVK